MDLRRPRRSKLLVRCDGRYNLRFGMNQFSSPFTSIAEKVLQKERLSFDDGVTLFRSNDVVAIGRLANHTRERLNGNRAFYNVNRNINYTNVCVIDCQLYQK